MNNKHTVLYVLGAILLLVVLFFAYKSSRSVVDSPVVTNFEECKNAGYPVMESYPEQCRTPDGRNFVNTISINEPEPNTPNTPPTKPIQTAVFNTPVTLNMYDRMIFADGLVISLKEINDSRCPVDVQCIWAGELSALFSISGGNLSTKQEIRLGTVNNKSISLEKYTFVLESATKTTATIRVVPQNSSRIAAGYISGNVHIGPFCPVEREDEPCKVPPEAYSSREVVVYLSDKVTVAEKGKLDSNGNYKIAIGPGNYFVQIVPAGIGPGEKKPATVKSFETTIVNFDIDTGIR